MASGTREIYPRVAVDLEVMHGMPVLTGTRIPISLALGQLASGVSYEEMRREYGLTPQQLQAALGYAAQPKELSGGQCIR